MQPVHQNTSKLRAAQRKKQQNLLKKERKEKKRRRRDPAIAASFKEAPHVTRRRTVRYGTVTYHGLLMLFWSTLREVGRYPDNTTNESCQWHFPAANGGSDEDLGGYSRLLIGLMVPLSNCDAL